MIPIKRSTRQGLKTGQPAPLISGAGFFDGLFVRSSEGEEVRVDGVCLYARQFDRVG